MDSTPTPFDSDAPIGARRAIIRRNPDDLQEIEMVEATWGSNPRFSGGVEYRFVRSEGRTFPSYRCLMAASEFHMQVGKKLYRAKLEDGNFFYLAAVWEPPMAGCSLAFRIITVAANSEISHHQDRQGAIILRRQAQAWLDGTTPESNLLVTPPAHSFVVEEIKTSSRSVQTEMRI